MLIAGGVLFSKRKWRVSVGANNRKLYNVAHAGAFRCINKRIGHCHLIWYGRRQQENLFDVFQRVREGCRVFKIECRQLDVSAELFSCFGLIAHARTGTPFSENIFTRSRPIVPVAPVTKTVFSMSVRYSEPG